MDKLEIIDCTLNPLDTIARVAGTSYGKDDFSHRRVINCFKRKHLSVFEQAYITVRVEGISRACANQLVRHRHVSYCQESQRYVKVDTDSDWYVIPPDIKANEDVLFAFKTRMINAAEGYNYAIQEGIKAEDARYLLPQAAKTKITFSMNVRELFHFLDLRVDQAAQWEIRELAYKLHLAVADINEQWYSIMLLWEDSDEKIIEP